MPRRSSILLLFLICVPARANAQQTATPDSTSRIQPKHEQFEELLLDAISDLDDAPQLLDDALDEIQSLTDAPVPLSRATREMLARIPTLDPMEIEYLLSHPLTDRPRQSRAITDASKYLAPEDSGGARVKLRSRLKVDPNASGGSGYASGEYLGGQQRYYNSLSASTPDLSLSVLDSKDPGEPKFDDLLRACISTRAPIPLTSTISLSQFAVGNYTLSFGNGLVFGNGWTSLKTREAVRSEGPHSSGIGSSTSARALLGAAAQLSVGSSELAFFYSDAPIDASIDSVGDISSLPTDGYHRTESELVKRNAAHLKLVGGHYKLTPNLFDGVATSLGTSAVSESLDHPIEPNPSSSRVGAERESIVAIDGNAATENYAINAEAAYSRSDTGWSFAEAATLMIAATPDLEFGLAYRNLPPSFLSRFAAVFGERSADGQSEQGTYAGITWRLYPSIVILNLYSDLSSSVSQAATPPLHQSDVLLGLDFFPGHIGGTGYFQIHRKSKDESIVDITPQGLLESHSGSRTATNYRLVARFAPNDRISIRIEGQAMDVMHNSSSSSSDERGFLFSIASSLRFRGSATLSAGLICFSTPSYDSRLYAYEPDLPGSASLSPLYDRGLRYYGIATANPADEIKLSVKGSVTSYTSPRIIGSGLSAYTGVREIEVGVQADILF